MNEAFWIGLTLSVFVGGAWVLVSTWMGERFGTRAGGLIGGFPSTAAVSLLFIGITQDPHIASDATLAMPLIQAINGIFLLIYMHLARRGGMLALGSALVGWLLLSGSVALLGIRTFRQSVLIWIVLAVLCGIWAEKGLHIPAQAGSRVRQTPAALLGRALFGGVVIGAAVFLAKQASPYLGGILATFPAMFLATLIVVHRRRGAEFGRGMAKALMYSGLINIALYAIVIRAAYPALGLFLGTIAGLLVALGASCALHPLLRKFS